VLLKRDWTRDHIYLFTYPRCRRIPNISPWSLKLETWLRMARLPYTAISTNFCSKRPLPFVEVNGRQIEDSNVIIEALTKEFNVTIDSSLTLETVSRNRAITALVEEEITPTLMALVLPDVGYLVTEEAWGSHLGRGITGWARRKWMKRRMRRQIASSVHIRGVDRHSYSEQTDLIKEGLDALAVFLNEGRHFCPLPSTIDATVFGHIACLIYAPTPDGVLTDYVRISKPSLGRFIETMKETLWPDWEETCSTGNMNTHHHYRI
ncbi:hypothetical protein PMAYCL1PPCAC_23023, partial [Pristionchus mayeri]